VAGRDGVVLVDQGAIRGSRRSNPATYTGLLDPIRKAFAKANGVKPAAVPEAVRGPDMTRRRCRWRRSHCSCGCPRRPRAPVAPRWPRRDRDRKHSGSFDEVFRTAGRRIVKAPVRAPKAKRHRRAFRQNRSRRMPRLAADTQPPPPRARAACLRRARQHAETAWRARPPGPATRSATADTNPSARSPATTASAA
jgi:hypothetical protein